MALKFPSSNGWNGPYQSELGLAPGQSKLKDVADADSGEVQVDGTWVEYASRMSVNIASSREV